MKRKHQINMLCLPKYSANGASSRVRTYQYINEYEKKGIKCHVYPLFGENHLNRLYTKKNRSIISILIKYISRIKILVYANKYNLILIEKELFPWVPLIENWIFKLINIPIITDYDDAIFHKYDQHLSWLVRKVLKNKISEIMSNSAAVIVGNKYLESYAYESGAGSIYNIPTVVNPDDYNTLSENHDTFIIGYICTPWTVGYIELIHDALKTLSINHHFILRIIGGGDYSLNSVTIQNIEWSEATQVNRIAECDIGIMPLPDTPWERGKCGYKLIQFMACGKPVIASPVGANMDIIDHGINGFLAESSKDWVVYIKRYILNSAEKITAGISGYKKVNAKYSTKIQVETLINIFNHFAKAKK